MDKRESTPVVVPIVDSKVNLKSFIGELERPYTLVDLPVFTTRCKIKERPGYVPCIFIRQEIITAEGLLVITTERHLSEAREYENGYRPGPIVNVNVYLSK